MRVNSAFTGFFHIRLVVLSIVIPAIIFIATSFSDHADRDIRVKQIYIVIRQLGHRLLLQAGDSTSTVMPVTEIKKGTFQLRFENEFIFNHDSLLALSKSLLPKTQFPFGYTVTVHDCRSGGIVYGFQLNNNSPDMLACSGRRQPSGCYIIEFSFPDFYEDLKETKVGIDQLSEPANVEKKDVDPKAEASKATTLAGQTNLRTEDANSLKPGAREVDAKLEELKSKTVHSPSINLVFAGMLVLLTIILVIGRYRKVLKPSPVQDQDFAITREHAITQEQAVTTEHGIIQDQLLKGGSVPEFPSLGKFLFDVKDQRLLSGSEVVSLTDKECKVLNLLHQNFGELIPRETLMNEVWIKEGVITGRSLDMFVSKLRKKLSPDPGLRITNVHGKGYKLEITGRQIS